MSGGEIGYDVASARGLDPFRDKPGEIADIYNCVEERFGMMGNDGLADDRSAQAVREEIIM
jgi:hypothetical protein